VPLPSAFTFLVDVDSVASAVEQLGRPGRRPGRSPRRSIRDGAAQGGDVMDLLADGRRPGGLRRDRGLAFVTTRCSEVQGSWPTGCSSRRCRPPASSSRRARVKVTSFELGIIPFELSVLTPAAAYDNVQVLFRGRPCR